MKEVVSSLKDRLIIRLNGEAVWIQFKINLVNNPNHFSLIKNELLPIANKNSQKLWITNYRNEREDFILLRVKSTNNQIKRIENRLSSLRQKDAIANFEKTTWDPLSDARNRIQGLNRLNFNSNNNVITSFDEGTRTIHLNQNTNLPEREKQLAAFFETVGKCTNVIYKNLESKPNDP
jgi:hypothetical protein